MTRLCEVWVWTGLKIFMQKQYTLRRWIFLVNWFTVQGADARRGGKIYRVHTKIKSCPGFEELYLNDRVVVLTQIFSCTQSSFTCLLINLIRPIIVGKCSASKWKSVSSLDWPIYRYSRFLVALLVLVVTRHNTLWPLFEGFREDWRVQAIIFDGYRWGASTNRQ